MGVGAGKAKALWATCTLQRTPLPAGPRKTPRWAAPPRVPPPPKALVLLVSSGPGTPQRGPWNFQPEGPGPAAPPGTASCWREQPVRRPGGRPEGPGRHGGLGRVTQGPATGQQGRRAKPSTSSPHTREARGLSAEDLAWPRVDAGRGRSRGLRALGEAPAEEGPRLPGLPVTMETAWRAPSPARLTGPW